MKGLSLSWLDELWRRAVRKSFDNKCFFCGADISSVEMECHHYIHRNQFLLKFSFRNGFLCCKHQHEYNKHLKMSCHQFADSLKGRNIINKYLVENDYMDYLVERSGLCKQWFVEKGITRNEYLLEMKNELLEIINAD